MVLRLWLCHVYRTSSRLDFRASARGIRAGVVSFPFTASSVPRAPGRASPRHLIFPRRSMFTAEFGSRSSLAPHRGHSQLLSVSLSLWLMNPQMLHVFDVYAGETYSTGTPAARNSPHPSSTSASSHRASCATACASSRWTRPPQPPNRGSMTQDQIYLGTLCRSCP